MSQLLKQKYKIIKQIANGRFSTIYEGIDNNEKIAIKEFPEEMTDKTFNIYIDLIKKLKSNNSININDYFKENKKFYVIMDLCDCNLYEFIGQYKNGLTLSLIQKILIQLNVALKNIRFKYFIDKYINPGDILIKYKNDSKTDFDVKLTGYLTGIIYKDKFKFEDNILCYRAPELDGDKVDIWSLGITIYFMYYKEFTLEKINQNKLFSMNKPLNNTNFKNLLNGLLNIDENKRISWIDYFNHPFFKENIVEEEIKESPNLNKEESINMSEVERNDNENLSEEKNDNDENVELNLGPEEKEIINKIDEKQNEFIKNNVELNLNPEEKNNDRRNLIINMIEVGSMYAEKIRIIKKNDPNYFLNIDEIIKDENHNFFPICILAKTLEKNGILVGVEKNKNIKDDELLRNTQYLGNGICNLMKFEMGFDFDEKRNEELLENINEQNSFNDEILQEISKLTETPIEDLILCNPRKGSYKIDLAFLNKFNFEGLVDVLKKISVKCNKIEIKEKPLLEGMILNTRMFDKKGNRLDGWGQGETRGGFPYYPPLGWTGYGIKVENHYDRGNNTWLKYDDSKEGVWSVVYHGTSLKYIKSIMENGLKQGNRQLYRDKQDENHPNQTIGVGVYTTNKIEEAEDYSENVDGYVCVFMCRANPKLARIYTYDASQKIQYWVLNGTSEDLRPYRLLIKKK